MPKGPFSPSTGIMIRDHLADVGENYPYGIYRHLREALTEEGYHAPTYDSVRRFLYSLRRAGLITLKRSEDTGKPFPRNYYAIVPRLRRSDIWLDPVGVIGEIG